MAVADTKKETNHRKLRIRASRKMLGLNQKDFSEECGLDRSYFGGVERGGRNLDFF
jgi:transcriptional regulator with XRE-family HTH domain